MSREMVRLADAFERIADSLEKIASVVVQSGQLTQELGALQMNVLKEIQEEEKK